jgi:hypothetical protein
VDFENVAATAKNGMSHLSWMSRRRARAWAAWLLPALFLRSLIPIGFMPMFSPGHDVELVLCAGYAPVPSMTTPGPMEMSNDMAMDADMNMSQSAHHDAAPGHAGNPPDHGMCSYGSGPALGTPLALSSISIRSHASAQLPAESPQVGHYQAPHRAQSARGPPV